MIYLSIGSNLPSRFGNRFDNIRKTLNLILEKKIKINKVSNFYESPSYPNISLPKFINIIAEIEYKGEPEDLLKKILNIEKKMERIRSIKNAPRTCDIDIVDFKGKIIENSIIKLPHPRAHERNFVLYPLKDVNRDWKHPISDKKIDFLIKNLSIKKRNEITRLKESVIIDA